MAMISSAILKLLRPILRAVFGTNDLASVRMLRWLARKFLGRSFPGYELRDRINSELDGCATVLEIGAGLFEILKDVPASIVRVGVEIYLPYLEHRVSDDACVAIHGDAMAVDQLFLPRSFDAVMMIDVLEHFTPDDAAKLLQKAEAIARKKIIIFTPEGIHPQDKDDRGLGNDYYMTHRSVWYAPELERLGYSTEVWRNFHGLPGKDPNNLFCVKTLGQA